MKIVLKILVVSVMILICTTIIKCDERDKSNMNVQKEFFGKMQDGAQIDLYTLTNTSGMKVKITNYGGTITSIIVPDKDGEMGDVVLGYSKLKGYLKNNPYFGGIIGRYGNRIAKGKFTLDGKTYTLATNNSPNHLHGGEKGFDKVIWTAKQIRKSHEVGLELSYLSLDGEEGYPGNLSVTVVYTLTEESEIKIDYSATTDQKTIVNLTNHSYFNLKDGGASSILNHELMIDAERFTPIDKTLIPTGEFRKVEGTPFDFRMPTKIGAHINEDNQQLENGLGYDHNFVLNGKWGELRLVAKLYEPTTKRVMEIWTEEPGLQFYSGNFLDGSITGKEGKVYEYRHGLCLETQHFPDSPNQPNFPSTVLNPNEKYKTTTIYKFSIKK